MEAFYIGSHVVTTLLGYIDPGSGSAIMSAIIGIIVALGLAIKTYWYKLKNFVTGKKSSDKNATDSKDKTAEK